MGQGRAVVLVLLAAMMWGTTGTARALAPPEASPLAIGAVRIAIGGAVLVLVAIARGGLLSASWPLWPSMIAAAGVAAYQLCFFEGVARAGVAAGTIVAIGSAPIFAGLIGWLALRERPSLRWAAATVLATAGVTLLALPHDERPTDTLALVLPLGAGLSYAVYATAAKVLLPARDHIAVAAVAFAGGAILLSPALALSDLGWVTQPRGALASLELGLVATALAYALFTRGLARLPVSWGATLSLAEPLTASVLGVLVLRETLAPAQVAGALFIAIGLAALVTGRARS